MADVSYWEACFVREYVVPAKREKYLRLLKGRKNRREILELLNHSLDYDPQKSTPLTAAYMHPTALLEFLRDQDVADTCHFMADSHPDDGHELRVEVAVKALLGCFWGALMICPHQGNPESPIAVYKPKGARELIFLNL